MSCNLIIKKHGFRLTPQRRMILDVLHGSGAHLTAEEIIIRIQASMPGVNKTTIYRTLDLLESLGCVYKSEAEGKHIYHHAEKGGHHHLVCSACGSSLDCDEGLFKAIEAELKQKYGFKCDLNHMVITGVCRDCRD